MVFELQLKWETWQPCHQLQAHTFYVSHESNHASEPTWSKDIWQQTKKKKDNAFSFHDCICIYLEHNICSIQVKYLYLARSNPIYMLSYSHYPEHILNFISFNILIYKMALCLIQPAFC